MNTSHTRVEVLGKPRVLVNGTPVSVRARPLEVLAFLALSDDLSVTYRELYDAFSANAESTVRAHVSDLRDRLGKAVVSRDREVLRLHIDREHVDAARFGKLVGQARGQSHDRRVVLLREARDLWRPGEPFRDPDSSIAARFHQLRDRRYAMYSDLIGSETYLGEHDEAVADAESAVRLWPVDEALWSLLLDTLVAAGRQSEVGRHWATYEQNVARERVKPSAQLRARVKKLADDPPSAPSARTSPYQVPRYDTFLHGRDEELARLGALLDDSATAPGLTLITGPPGVGKTALAMAWANRFVDRFPDGNLHIDLAGFAGRPPVPTDEVLAGFLRELLRMSPNGLSHQELVTAYRTALATRSVLVVLDNAADWPQVEHLIAVGTRSRTVITSRSALLNVDTSCTIELGPLSATDGLRVLSDVIDDRRVRDEPAAAAAIVDRCGGLPLAITLVAARARLWRSRMLRTIKEELEETGAILDIDVMKDRSLRDALAWSYRALSDDAARVLRVVGLHPGPSVRSDLIAYLAGLGPRDTTRALDELLRHALVQSVAGDRIASHDVIQEYAVAVVTETAGDEVDRVREKVLEYLLWAAVRCDRALDSGRDLPVGEPDDSAPVPSPTTKEEAAAWLEAEHNTYLAALRSHQFARWTSYRWLLPAALCAYQNRAGHWTTAEQLLRDALNVDKPDQEQAVNLRLVCLIQRKLGKLHLAAQHAMRSIRLCQENGWLIDEAHARQQLSVVHEDTEQWGEAWSQATAAHAIYLAEKDSRGISHTLNTMVSVDLSKGRSERAVASGLTALDAMERDRDAYGRASVHRNLHRAYAAREEWENAVKHGEAAAALYAVDSPANEAHVLCSLLAAYRRLDRHSDERRAAARALDLLRGLPSRRRQDDELFTMLTSRLSG